MPLPQSSLRSAVLSGLLVVLAASAAAQPSTEAPYYISTLAGFSAQGSRDGTGATARFGLPVGIVVDPANNVFVADSSNNTIRKITPAGVVTTLAGSPGFKGLVDGPGATARFDIPWALAIDVAGNLYVEDVGNNAVRKVTPQGEVTTIPDKHGIADMYATASRIPDSTVQLLATKPLSNGYYYAYGKAYQGVMIGSRGLTAPGLAADSAGNAYVIDDSSIRKITPAGSDTTLAGSPKLDGAQDGVGSAARFDYMLSPATDMVSNVYVAEYTAGRIRKITPSGEVTTLAGVDEPNGTPRDGAKADARFAAPAALAVDSTGNVLVTDTTAIRVITPSGSVSTRAGIQATSGSVDGSGSSAQFGNVAGLTLSPDGNLYACDSEHSTIRRITPGGVVTTFAGIADHHGHADGAGTQALFSRPEGIACDRTGNLYVADSANHAIRKITPAGLVTTVAGNPGVMGSSDGTGSSATFEWPHNIAVDADGYIFVLCDSTTPSLRVISAAGEVRSLASSNWLLYLANDQAGHVYTCEAGPKVTRLTPDGLGTVALDVSSTWALTRTADNGADSSFGPFCVDSNGTVYANGPTGLIRKISTAGTITDLAGTWLYAPGISWQPSVDGIGSNARFGSSLGCMAVDSAAGTLYIADGSTIRKGQLAGPVTITAQPQSQNATAGTNVQLSVTATGIPAPTYQWRFSGTPISGATAATLNLPSVTAANAGDYTVVATNALGSATSASATLAVTAAPVTPSTPSTPSSGGGGGALGLGFALALLVLGAVRRFTPTSVSP